MAPYANPTESYDGSRGGGDVANEIRKRLASIARWRSFVDWRKVKELGRDLEAQREAIAAHVAATSPGEAFDLLWRMLEMAPSIYERWPSWTPRPVGADRDRRHVRPTLAVPHHARASQ